MNPSFRDDFRPAASRWLAALWTASLALVAGLALATTPATSHAAALNLSVTDAAGKPLVDAVALLESANGKPPVKPMADVEISQAKRQFHPRVTLITTGTRASLPNFDTVRHHVYSFSPIKTFEVKLYAGVPSQPITFDKPGIAVLGCNIHDTMAAWVVVSDTPWFALSGANGRARIEGVPAGSYKLRLWHPALAPNTEAPPISITVGAGDLEQRAQLAVSDEP